ncbi:MAG: DUF1707 domain-containing protein [Gemmatimonadota bacterium]
MADRPLPQQNLKQQRERTIQLLCDGFAQDRLELADFEARLDVANRAATVADLDALTSDLPAVRTAAPAAARGAVERGSRAARNAVQDSRTLIAVMGGVERRGPWKPSRKTFALAVMGGVSLDFRDVEMPAGQTEVHLFCFMGGAEIIVPPGLAVDATGVAIMGGFEHASAPGSPGPDTPVLRIDGLCIMGGVEIAVRERGESERDARLRQRQEKKTLRERARQQRPGAE